MKRIGKLFVQGFMAVLPIILTLYILYWSASTIESFLGRVISEKWYIPGMGIVGGFILILGIGILLQVWLFRKLFELGERLLEHVPLIKSLYGSIRDLMSFFDATKQKEFDKVVMVTFADSNIRLLGLVTREDFNTAAAGIDNGNTVGVYLPMSYQIGGFTVFVSRENIQPVDMTIEEAMRFVLTAGVSSEKHQLSDKL